MGDGEEGKRDRTRSRVNGDEDIGGAEEEGDMEGEGKKERTRSRGKWRQGHRGR